MNNPSSPFSFRLSRMGFHYFPDTIHFCESDAETWIPQLTQLGASWLVIQSEANRAVPEHFISSLVKAKIEPFIQLNLSFDNPPETSELQTLFETYARWGVRVVQIFDRPNDRAAWQSSDWVQQDLVERFLERYLPVANLALDSGLISAFPTLEPGGSYWDTAFLRSALISLERRKQNRLLKNLVLTAYGWTRGHSLNWGAGGPQRWSGAKPYFTPPNEQDHRGFRIFEWYDAASREVLGESRPIVLLGAGNISNGGWQAQENISPAQHAKINYSILRLLAGENVQDPNNSSVQIEPIPEYVIACNFWLLTAEENSPAYRHAWFQGKEELPIVQAVYEWSVKDNQPAVEPAQEKNISPPQVIPTMQTATPKQTSPQPSDASAHPIQHYLLLPTYEWGVAEWHLDIIQPFIIKYRPTVGFSLDEAMLAKQVTLIGSEQAFPENVMEKLTHNGCSVERIDGDGTTIASKLAAR